MSKTQQPNIPTHDTLRGGMYGHSTASQRQGIEVSGPKDVDEKKSKKQGSIYISKLLSIMVWFALFFSLPGTIIAILNLAHVMSFEWYSFVAWAPSLVFSIILIVCSIQTVINSKDLAVRLEIGLSGLLLLVSIAICILSIVMNIFIQSSSMQTLFSVFAVIQWGSILLITIFGIVNNRRA